MTNRLHKSFWHKSVKINALVQMLMVLVLLMGSFSLQAQSKHHTAGDVYIAGGGFIYIAAGDTVNLQGKMLTVRDTAVAKRGMLSFAYGATGWTSDNGSYVDGYVRSHKSDAFVFPVGQGGYRPAAISAAADMAPTDAAYYNTAQYNKAALGAGLSAITDESWIILGTTPAVITLSWTSNISGFAGDIKQLYVAGWDTTAKKWVKIESAVDMTVSPIFGTYTPGLTSKGSVSTTAAIVPNDYGAYTLGRDLCTLAIGSLYATQQPTCTGGGLGSIYVDIVGGSGDYSYVAKGISGTLTGSDTIKNLPADNYIFTVTDEVTGCKAVSHTVPLVGSGALTVASEIETTPASSCGIDDGTITVTVSGTTDYSYCIEYFDGTSYFTPTCEKAVTSSDTFTENNMPSGEYLLTIIDDNGCKAPVGHFVIGVEKENFNLPFLVKDVENVVCAGIGSFTIKMIDPLKLTESRIDYYRLNGGIWVPFLGDSVHVSTHPGDYTIELMNENQICISELTHVKISLLDANAFEVEVVLPIVPATCGRDNGAITLKIDPVDLSATYYYSYDTEHQDIELVVAADGTCQIENLAAGSYDILIYRDPEIGETCLCEYTVYGITVPQGPDNKVTPDFTIADIQTVYCQDDASDPDPLPTTDDNGITGHWENASNTTVTKIATDTPTAVGVPDIYTFVPDPEHCVTEPNVWIEVTVIPRSIAGDISISGTTSICSGTTTTLTALATTSTNPIYHWYESQTTTTPFFTGETYITSALTADSTFYVGVVNDDYCINAINDRTAVTVTVGGGGKTAAPSAITPQTFCENATVANLQTENGTNILWYLTATGGTPLALNLPLDDGFIYYAEQAIGSCTRDRTAVKVIINNDVFIDAPNIPNEVQLCSPAILADVPTDGNTNIRWYDQMVGGSEVNPATVVFTTDTSYYYAGLVGGGSCESIQRAEVMIVIVSAVDAPDMEEEQHFCPDALVGNLATPNNQIIWYKAGDTTPLLPEEKLENGWYEAVQKAGSCESARTLVEVILDKYPTPFAPLTQATCGETVYLSDLFIIGAGIKWYTTSSGATEITSPETTVAVPGNTYWAAQTSGTCESDRIAIEITAECYSPYGTLFPFVHTTDPIFNKQFVTTAKLYVLPPTTTLDKIGYLRKQVPIRETLVEYYDCTAHTVIIGAPKNPGTMGATNNPGLKILWNSIGMNSGIPDGAKLTATDKCPTAPIGRYTFDNIAAGTYVLEIARQGFLTRYGVITVTGSNYLGHRELLAGDINGDLVINAKDLSAITPKLGAYNAPNYAWKYDFNGNKNTNKQDVLIIQINLNAYITIYEETEQWANH